MHDCIDVSVDMSTWRQWHVDSWQVNNSSYPSTSWCTWPTLWHTVIIKHHIHSYTPFLDYFFCASFCQRVLNWDKLLLQHFSIWNTVVKAGRSVNHPVPWMSTFSFSLLNPHSNWKQRDRGPWEVPRQSAALWDTWLFHWISPQNNHTNTHENGHLDLFQFYFGQRSVSCANVVVYLKLLSNLELLLKT